MPRGFLPRTEQRGGRLGCGFLFSRSRHDPIFRGRFSQVSHSVAGWLMKFAHAKTRPIDQCQTHGAIFHPESRIREVLERRLHQAFAFATAAGNGNRPSGRKFPDHTSQCLDQANETSRHRSIFPGFSPSTNDADASHHRRPQLESSRPPRRFDSFVHRVHGNTCRLQLEAEYPPVCFAANQEFLFEASQFCRFSRHDRSFLISPIVP